MQTHYALLNVSENADAATIRLAYRRLLRQWHPDRNSNSQAAHVTQRLNAAYKVLCNDFERRAYDLRLASERARVTAASPPAAVEAPRWVQGSKEPGIYGLQPKVAWQLVVAALRRLGNRVRP